MFDSKLISITEKIIHSADYRISADEALYLSELPENSLLELVICSDRIKKNYNKAEIHTCSVINAKSGFCSENCAFCAQSSYHHTSAETYPLMSREDMVSRAVSISRSGASYFSFVTSGYELTDNDIDVICSAAEEIKSRTSLRLCASLGMLNMEKGIKLFNSGIENYHHNLETARSFFRKYVLHMIMTRI